MGFYGAKKAVLDGINKLVNEYGLSYRNFTVYCLSGFDSSFLKDYDRVMVLRELRIDPFIMLFRNTDGSEGTMGNGEPQDWRLKHLTRWVNKRMLFRKVLFEDYEPYVKELKAREEAARYQQLSLFSFLDDEQTEKDDQMTLFDWLEQEYINVA
jgi:hypothetical protein